MTITRTLSMKFGLESGAYRNISLSDPKADISSAEVSAAMAALVTSGAAFADPLVSSEKAELVEREVTVLVDNQ